MFLNIDEYKMRIETKSHDENSKMIETDEVQSDIVYSETVIEVVYKQCADIPATLREIESDQAMKQFLLHLDETLKLGRKFIIQDLDENHLFISADILDTLQAKIDDLMDQISFPLAEKSG